MPRKKTGRSRGGQPGNINALKHGMYTDKPLSVESAYPGAVEANSLIEEVKILRTMIGRVLNAAQEITELDELITVLNGLGTASGRIAQLLKINQTLVQLGEKDEIMSALNQALKEVNEGMSWP